MSRNKMALASQGATDFNLKALLFSSVRAIVKTLAFASYARLFFTVLTNFVTENLEAAISNGRINKLQTGRDERSKGSTLFVINGKGLLVCIVYFSSDSTRTIRLFKVVLTKLPYGIFANDASS